MICKIHEEHERDRRMLEMEVRRSNMDSVVDTCIMKCLDLIVCILKLRKDEEEAVSSFGGGLHGKIPVGLRDKIKHDLDKIPERVAEVQIALDKIQIVYGSSEEIKECKMEERRVRYFGKSEGK